MALRRLGQRGVERIVRSNIGSGAAENANGLCYDHPVSGSPRNMNPDRPVNLSLPRLAMAMPVTAAASILHRITGIVLFLGTFFLCYLLDRATAGPAGFEEAAAILAEAPGKIGLWVVLTSLAYHFAAGVKHLLLDFHIGDSLAGGRAGAWISLALAAVAGVVLALWLW